jgi:hypothetical protein
VIRCAVRVHKNPGIFSCITVEELGLLLPELDAGVTQLTTAMERPSAPRCSWFGGEPDSTIADAERRTRLEYWLAEALPVLRDAKFWLGKHTHAS